MIFTLDFLYPIIFIPYKHQNDKILKGKDTIDLNIKEISENDFEYLGNITSNKDNIHYSIQGNKKNLILYQDKTFVEWGKVDDLLNSKLLLSNTPFRKEKTYEYGEQSFDFHGHPIKQYTTIYEIEQKFNPHKNTPLRKINDDSRMLAIQSFKKRSENLIIFNDTIFEYIGDIVLKYNKENLSLSIQSENNFYIQDNFYEDDILYRLEDLDKIKQIHKNINKEELEIDISLNINTNLRKNNFDFETKNIIEILKNKILCKKIFSFPKDLASLILDLKEAFDATPNQITNRIINCVTNIMNYKYEEDTEKYNIKKSLINLLMKQEIGDHNHIITSFDSDNYILNNYKDNNNDEITDKFLSIKKNCILILEIYNLINNKEKINNAKHYNGHIEYSKNITNPLESRNMYGFITNDISIREQAKIFNQDENIFIDLFNKNFDFFVIHNNENYFKKRFSNKKEDYNFLFILKDNKIINFFSSKNISEDTKEKILNLAYKHIRQIENKNTNFQQTENIKDNELLGIIKWI